MRLEVNGQPVTTDIAPEQATGAWGERAVTPLFLGGLPPGMEIPPGLNTSSGIQQLGSGLFSMIFRDRGDAGKDEKAGGLVKTHRSFFTGCVGRVVKVNGKAMDMFDTRRMHVMGVGSGDLRLCQMVSEEIGKLVESEIEWK